jgi:DNA-binding transcriptional LysR family regulator
VLGDFHRVHPAVEIILTEHHNERLHEALARGDADAAFIGITGEPLPPHLRARVIATEPLVLAVRPTIPSPSARASASAGYANTP